MRDQKFRKYRFVLALAFVLVLGTGGIATADSQSSSSDNYSISQVQIGGNGSTQQVCSSGTYCASEAVGDTAVGDSGSSNYSAQFGSDTTDQPLLEVIADGGTQNLGVLDPSATGTASFTLKIRSYLSDGYIVQISGAPPTQGTHTLKAMDPDAPGDQACPCTSQPGAEQFGINLAKNTAPDITASADAVQVPDDTYSFGEVANGTGGGSNGFSPHDYSTSNQFLYENGDVVAGSVKSTGETDYTISMILNVSAVTPAGHYKGTYAAVVTPNF